MKELHYYDQLIHLSLMSLQRRRERFILLHLWKILHGQTSNDLNVQLVSRLRLGTLAIIPSKSRTSSAANQTLFDNSFAVQSPKLWNAMPHNLNSIQSLEHFKDQLTKFLLPFPDMPPIRGMQFSKFQLSAVLAYRVRLYLALGWSELLMALSSFDEAQHR